MRVFLTGVAGFIGFHVASALLARGDQVVGVDNMNPYYDVKLKQARLQQLQGKHGFVFAEGDISDRQAMTTLGQRHPDITHVVHLAAQAGVRHSLTDPYTYITSNVMGQVVMLEMARSFRQLEHFVYASSSSVYGGNTKLPFSIEDETEKPNSLYAATKKADELIGHTYAHLYDLPSTGLRFFTVYGPWGRPDMAAYLFTDAIVKGEPIKVFNDGNMWRDFTYIDDIVRGILATLSHAPSAKPRHGIYNLGNHRSEKLTDFISVIEASLGKKASYRFEPMQPGDVERTFADIEASRRDLGFEPRVPISEGIPKFVEWFKTYHRVWPSN
jgi:UDP-glucuronate 4-epimerase